MNAEALLAQYERIAEAPDAIARLRRFVLDLAVRGKLVPQDAQDEPATKQLALLSGPGASSRRSRRDSPTSDGATSQIDTTLLPRGWAAVTAREIFPTRSGNSKLIKGRLYAEPAVGRFPGYSAAGQDVWLDTWEHEGTAVILSAVGARCGKAFLAKGKWSAIANTHIVWVLDGVTLPEFAMLHLNNEVFWIRSGGAQPFVKVGETLARTFLLPPLAEQHRIVAKVDELMALCDRLEAARTAREATRDRLAAASLARLKTPDPETFPSDARFALDALPALTTRPDQIKHLRETILNLAVRGKLVPQDPSDEPAAELLRRLADSRASASSQRVTRGQVSLPDVDTSQAPFDLPSGWAWARFPELGTFGRGRSKHRPRNDPALFVGGEHPFIQTGDVARSNGVIRTYTGKYNDVGLAQSRKWPRGTLCITIAANIADSGILDFAACFPDSVVGFVPDPLLQDAAYFEFFMRTAKSRLLDFAPATAQKNINLDILTQVLIPLPPIAEQRRVVAKVDEAMQLCDALERRLAEASAVRSRLLDAVLRSSIPSGEPVELVAA